MTFPVINTLSRARLQPITALLPLLFFLGNPTMPAQTAETWASADIGAVGLAGNSSESGNVVTVRGSGADIWGAADGFHFRSQTISGNGSLRARITTTGSGNAWAKVGLMIREDLTPGSRNLMALLTPGGSLGVQIRSTAGGTTTYTEQMRTGAPIWLMLIREGNNVAAYRSADGDRWTAMGPTITLPLPTTVHIGLAVTSHHTGTLQTATFDNVTRIGGGGEEVPIAPLQLRVHSPFWGALQLDWDDRSNNETGFKIERSSGGGPFTFLANAEPNATAFVDQPLESGTVYTYRVCAFRNGSTSAYSSSASGQFGSAPLESGWAGFDIGDTGSVGSDSGVPPAFTMNAGGSDIYGTTDSFHYRFKNLTGDGTVVARIASQTNTHPWAKAGVMYRTSLAPGAANVAMLLTPGNGATFQARRFANHLTSHLGIGGRAAPYWVRLQRVGNTFTGSVSANGSDWTFVGSQVVDMPAMAYIGFAGCSHASAQTIISFDQATADGPPPPATTLTQRNLGSGTGSVTDESNITIQATSGDIYGTADSGVFYSKAWTGAAVFTTRVDQLTRTHDWAKAGIMFRAGLGAGAANVFVAITPTQGAVLQSRSAAGGATITHGRTWGVGTGKWIRIYRDGGAIAAYWSNDGGNWNMIGSVSDTLPETIEVGLAVSSHNPAAATTAVFTGLGDI